MTLSGGITCSRNCISRLSLAKVPRLPFERFGEYIVQFDCIFLVVTFHPYPAVTQCSVDFSVHLNRHRQEPLRLQTELSKVSNGILRFVPLLALVAFLHGVLA